MELPQRKTGRLKGFDYGQGGAYFITLCTQDRRKLFGEIVESVLCGQPYSPHIMIEKWLLEMPGKYPGVCVEQYVIMPNHLHFIAVIAETQGEPLPKMMDWFKTMTTNEYIRGVREGRYQPFQKRLWQRSYYDHIIRNEEDYRNIWAYIDTNPLKWEEDRFYEPPQEGRG